MFTRRHGVDKVVFSPKLLRKRFILLTKYLTTVQIWFSNFSR